MFAMNQEKMWLLEKSSAAEEQTFVISQMFYFIVIDIDKVMVITTLHASCLMCYQNIMISPCLPAVEDSAMGLMIVL